MRFRERRGDNKTPNEKGEKRRSLPVPEKGWAGLIFAKGVGKREGNKIESQEKGKSGRGVRGKRPKRARASGTVLCGERRKGE